jgi:hypothetical protein
MKGQVTAISARNIYSLTEDWYTEYNYKAWEIIDINLLEISQNCSSFSL